MAILSNKYAHGSTVEPLLLLLPRRQNRCAEVEVSKELETFTTADLICIAQTVTSEVSSHKDASIHAAAGAVPRYLRTRDTQLQRLVHSASFPVMICVTCYTAQCPVPCAVHCNTVFSCILSCATTKDCSLSAAHACVRGRHECMGGRI